MALWDGSIDRRHNLVPQLLAQDPISKRLEPSVEVLQQRDPRSPFIEPRYYDLVESIREFRQGGVRFIDVGHLPTSPRIPIKKPIKPVTFLETAIRVHRKVPREVCHVVVGRGFGNPKDNIYLQVSGVAQVA